ncbi:MAG: cadmium-translocating P-type ATPase, partial [Clostridiales bacterium]|nr:cadmium-translocating P-type ATPase [Clostridiales bacterium]
RSEVNLPMNRLTIEYDEDAVTPQMICEKVEKAGFTARPHNQEITATGSDDGLKELKAERDRLIVMGALSVLLLCVSMLPMLVHGFPLPDIISMDTHPVNYALTQLLLTIPIIICGRRFFVNGFSSLIHGSPNMDALVAISSTASFVYSLVMTYLMTDAPALVHGLYFESSAIVLTLVALGKHLEENSKQKTKSAITKLMELSPDSALLVNDDGVWEVPTEILKVGDVVLVKPGARIPLDGVVTGGEGGVDESMLTGESLPVEKTEGSGVIGGSISVSGALYIRVTRIGEDTTLAGIIRFVEDAQGKKAPISKTADKVAGVFVPIVIATAITALAAWLIAGESFAFALKIFTTVLVIACPCAMGLATPTAIIVGTGLGASNGILIRSGEALEITHRTQVVVLDKTGTVTEGKPEVTGILPFGIDEEKLLSFAASVEGLSDHPLARAICEEAARRGLSLDIAVESFENLSGMGIKAVIEDGSTRLVGNRRLMEREGVDLLPFEAELESLTEKGQTIMLAAENGAVRGIVCVADAIKEGSQKAVAGLRKLGIRTILLTGDNRAAAEHIGAQAGVDEVIAEVLPEDKATVIEKLQMGGACVMMVGDGINDAPALTQADVGCAIGNGSDIAIESADVVLMKNDLNDVSRAIRLSRLTIRNIRQNLFWAFFYNVLGIPVAAGALYPSLGLLLSPMIGAAAMSLSSLFVVTNALRLRRKKI